MQQRGGAEGKDSLFSSDSMGGFPGFGLFGSHRSMMSNLFGERDPFDDPFFTRPFNSMLEPSASNSHAAAYDKGKKDGAQGLVIQEISSDEEREVDDDLVDQKQDKNENSYGSDKEPSVEHPDDPNDERRIITRRGSEDNSFGAQPKASKSSLHTCKVTYGGVDGAYYTSTRTRRVDNEGVLLEETKEADKTTGQATHRISRGIHDKGHSVTRKLNPDGKVDVLQTLHNLNEEELAGFEKAWKGNFQGHQNVPKGGFHMDPTSESSGSRNREMISRDFPSFSERKYEHGGGARESSGSGRTKKVIRINIE
ncbi:uncharacterized protein LOC111806546 [Cucurbita pepo subsp. pepo]|uniref:uncharacterized protein LOC111806546 n=1 Tax=Cucurbita pepo subsp. pepo TaxID=3664 RepID=UPI000C9D912A|nr:uncharacterized protein LOC111806546 [Cucurbita pepo subsp. pepo]XP_023547681.1 uncharacterized protein LOC111806546 [Cucurbita pepo subsp. pepo]